MNLSSSIFKDKYIQLQIDLIPIGSCYREFGTKLAKKLIIGKSLAAFKRTFESQKHLKCICRRARIREELCIRNVFMLISRFTFTGHYYFYQFLMV